jgi:hypothetical protein
MSLLFVDGFDHYATADITRKWTSTGVSFSGNAGIGSSVVRYGAGAFFSNTSTTATDRKLVKTLAASATWVVGFAFRTSGLPSAAGPIVGLFDVGTAQCDLRLNTDGTLSVTRNGTSLTSGTSVTALSANTWYYIEWKVTIADSISASTCKVRINGVDAITVATGQDLKNTANSSANQLYLGHYTVTSAGNIWYYDDLYVCNTSGSVNNDFLGDVRVETLYPSGAGNTTQFTPSAGSNYQCVDDADPDDDTTYVESGTVGHVDTYAFDDLSASPTSVFGIQTVIMARKTDGGSRTATPVVRSGGTDYDGTTFGLADTYTCDHQVWENDPDTAAAWTESGINAAEFGFEVVS